MDEEVVNMRLLPLLLLVLVVPPAFSAPLPAGPPVLISIPAGTFEMGDHHGFVDPKHGGDETPIHAVTVSAFSMGVNDVTNRQFAEFLNSMQKKKAVEVRDGGVYLTGGKDLLVETRTMSPYSCIGWDGKAFTILEKKEEHPVVCIRWHGAAACCN